VLEPFWTAVAFLMLGLILVLGEVWMPGNFIAVPGGALTFMGFIGLFAPNLMFDPTWGWFLWPFAAVASTLVNIWFYKRWAPPGAAPLTMGGDSLPGEEGVVVKEILPGAPGQVRIRGANWSARAQAGRIAEGRTVRVVRVDGIFAVVEPIEA
jgi:inner membrane protein